MERGGCVYTLINKNHTTLYTGVTSELKIRITKHKEKEYTKSFTSKYNIDKLIYFEILESIEEAIAREKQIKAGSRNNKLPMISKMNPEWRDLFDEIEF